MSAQNWTLINDFGEVFRLSLPAWRRYCRDYVATSGHVSLRDYGRSLGAIDHNVTDWGSEQFRDMLLEWNPKP